MNVSEQLRSAQDSVASSFQNQDPGVLVAPCPLAATHWIEIHLVDDAGRPMAAEPYTVYPPGGDPIAGTLDENGWARHEHLIAGLCKVVFPSRERTWWEPFPPPSPPPPQPTPPIVPATLPPIPDHWIELQLVDDTGEPVPFEPFAILYADGSLDKGELDERGFARVDGLMKGTYQIVFPSREPTWWMPDTPPTPPPVAKRAEVLETLLPFVAAPAEESEINYDGP